MAWLNLFKRPATPSQGPLAEKVRQAMADVQSYARSHGGNILLVGVSDDGDVRVRFEGACRSCPISDVTLKLGVEERLMQLVPGVRSVRVD